MSECPASLTVRSAWVRCCADSALAPATAMAAMGQPSLQSFLQDLSQQHRPGPIDCVYLTACLASLRCRAGSALAPATAMAAMGQPALQSFQQGADGNFNPTIQDWVTAYKPVDKALNKVFETRITNANARQVQFNLAVVRLPPPQQPSCAPVDLSCMVAYGRLALGITLSAPGLAESQGSCK